MKELGQVVGICNLRSPAAILSVAVLAVSQGKQTTCFAIQQTQDLLLYADQKESFRQRYPERLWSYLRLRQALAEVHRDAYHNSVACM